MNLSEKKKVSNYQKITVSYSKSYQNELWGKKCQIIKK